MTYIFSILELVSQTMKFIIIEVVYQPGKRVLKTIAPNIFYLSRGT